MVIYRRIQKIYLSNYSYSLAALLFPYRIRTSKRTTKNKSENRGETEIGRGKESNWQSVRGCVSILKRGRWYLQFIERS